MTELILIGAMVLSTGALMSTQLRRIRVAHVAMWLALAIEVVLLATLAFAGETSPSWWLPALLVILAGTNVILWAAAALQSLSSPR